MIRYLGLPLFGFPLPGFGLRQGAGLRLAALPFGLLRGLGPLDQAGPPLDPPLQRGQLPPLILGHLPRFAFGGGQACAVSLLSHREGRLGVSLDKELSDMLDLENTSSAYRLGRLFAALEKIQEEASPGLNATIRERYYGAASSTPVAVFTTLLRLKNHHLAKLTNRGRAVNFERLLGEIMGGLNDFPKHLSLPEQGRFSLGYYHQRQDFFSTPSKSMQSTQGESK